jgi:hypothetical protein
VKANGRVVDETFEPRFWFRAIVAVARRPRLWATAVRQLFALARPGWWRHPPFVPRPDPGYLSFRLETAYGERGGTAGGAGVVATVRDLVAYLEWCRGRYRCSPVHSAHRRAPGRVDLRSGR